VTWNAANLQDATWNGNGYTTVDDVSSQLGLHAGLGLSFALGKSVSADLEGRYIGWVSDSTPESQSAPGALQATAGLMVHFK
jgi:opacity protein-like surface antigen